MNSFESSTPRPLKLRFKVILKAFPRKITPFGYPTALSHAWFQGNKMCVCGSTSSWNQIVEEYRTYKLISFTVVLHCCLFNVLPFLFLFH
jgi:hypothetical protein